MAAQELQAAMNRLAGTTTLDAPAAANIWAGTTNLDLLGALNAKATARGYTGPPLGLEGVLNNLALTTNKGVNEAAGAIV